jgi:hypothetical protein
MYACHIHILFRELGAASAIQVTATLSTLTGEDLRSAYRSPRPVGCRNAPPPTGAARAASVMCRKSRSAHSRLTDGAGVGDRGRA